MHVGTKKPGSILHFRNLNRHCDRAQGFNYMHNYGIGQSEAGITQNSRLHINFTKWEPSPIGKPNQMGSLAKWEALLNEAGWQKPGNVDIKSQSLWGKS